MEALIHDCRIAYQYKQTSSTSETVVLFLHGWGCDGSVFAFFEKELSASCLTVDFPGHGQSGEPEVPWGVPEYAEQIRALLAELNVSRVHIVAHSFGGRVAIYLASHYPELVDKIVITGGAGIRKPASETQSKRQKTYKRLKAILEMIGKCPLFSSAVAKGMEKLRQKYGSPDYVRLNENMRKTFVKVISQDLSDMLPEIRSSTLLIWGSADTETPLWMGQKMEQSIPDAGLVVFEGRSHFAFVEEPQRFLTIVKTFFEEGDHV